MRTDIHSPKQFNPSDYEALEAWDLRLERPQPMFPRPGEDPAAVAAEYDRAMDFWRQEIARMKTAFGNGSVCDASSLSGGRWPHECDHCGQHNVRYAWSVLHKPTGQVICVGEICVTNKLELTRDEFKMKYIQDKASRDAAAAKKAALYEAWRTANPQADAFLRALPARESFEFLTEMVSKLRQYGELSPNQTSAVERIAVKRAQQAAERAEREATEVVPTTPAPEGRVTVTGKVVHTKTVESDFGSTMKMLVVLEDGNKVWTTIPSKLFGNDPVKGAAIKLTATFERSKDDEHFSFGKRPSAERI